MKLEAPQPPKEGETPAECRARELKLFRQRVNVYKLKLHAANRGLRNVFKMEDAK